MKLGQNRLNSKKPVEKTIVKKDKLRLAEKDDNLAVESTLVETKVKPARKPVVKAAPQKVQEAAKAPVDRATYAAPAPKFIIKQAGEEVVGFVDISVKDIGSKSNLRVKGVQTTALTGSQLWFCEV